MLDPARVARMRTLLTEAAPSTPPQPGRFFAVLGNSVVAGPLRRRAMVKQIALATERYGLQLDVEAYLAAAGVATVAGLDTPHLEVLARWVEQTMDRMTHACDWPDAPPAR